MKNKIEFFCNDYMPCENITWEKVCYPDSKKKYILKPYGYLFRARLYNRNQKHKMVFLNLFMYYDKTKENCFLVIRGRLNNWYFQNFQNEKLTTEQYQQALELLLSEIDLNKDHLLSRETGTMNFKMKIYLRAIFLKKYERVVKIIYE